MILVLMCSLLAWSVQLVAMSEIDILRPSTGNFNIAREGGKEQCVRYFAFS